MATEPVSPAEPPAGSHPEDTCEECGGPNVVWFAPNDVWNRVMRGGDRGAPDAVGIVCPVCFIRRAEALGFIPTGWSVQPEVIPADPSMSLADTIRRAQAEFRNEVDCLVNLADDDMASVSVDLLRLAAHALDESAALLAVGERDKAEIAELRGELAVAYGGPDRDGKQREWFSALDRAKAEAEDLRAAGERDRRQIARLTELFKPEPYRGVRNKLVCSECGGQGEVPGRNHDDPRWMQCLTCKGDGLSAGARAVLAGEEDAAPTEHDEDVTPRSDFGI